MRQALILQLQKFLKNRYNKTIVEIKDPFADMPRLLSGTRVGTIIDGGGYHGEVAAQLAGLFPASTVCAFEPSKKSFDILSANTKQTTRIKPVNLGLSSATSSRTLYVNAQDSTNSLSPVGEMGKKYQSWQTANVGSEEVRLVTLDSWAEKNGVNDIHIIKLDLQGHELEALKGAERTLR